MKNQNTVHFYFATTLMWNGSEREIVEIAKEYGADGVELWAQHAESVDYNLSALRKMLTESGLKSFIHSKSWDLNFASLNQEIRKTSIEEIKSSIRMANEMESKEVTVHPPRITLGTDPTEYYKWAEEGISILDDYAKSMGCRISVEMMEDKPKELAVTLDGIKRVTGSLYSKLEYTLDLAHCDSEKIFWSNYNNIPKISKLHVSNRQDKKLHTPLRYGMFDIADILKRVDSELPIVIEGYQAGNGYSILRDNLSYINEIYDNKGENLQDEKKIS